MRQAIKTVSFSLFFWKGHNNYMPNISVKTKWDPVCQLYSIEPGIHTNSKIGLSLFVLHINDVLFGNKNSPVMFQNFLNILGVYLYRTIKYFPVNLQYTFDNLTFFWRTDSYHEQMLENCRLVSKMLIFSKF